MEALQRRACLSTYLELRTAKYLAGEGSVVYSIDLDAMLRRMIDAELAPMNDPLGIVTRIRACSSDANRRTALSLMQQARAALARADEEERARDARAYWWHMADVYGPGFHYPQW